MLPTTPAKLGRYEIVDEVGKGAMGVVYLARDPLIGRLVALKTFRIGYSVKDQEMEQFRIRFMREAQSAGILSHPNIVTIHDVVEKTDEGMAFIAMEYVRGTNLKVLLQSDQPMPLSFVVDIVAQVAEALDYAHAHRVIHRDVKPANILITADNRVKITDFGIARLDTSNLTQEGQLLGTPNYMAPEQIQGKEVDHRADLFALGVVLYEMITRHKPFQGENLTVVSHRIVYDQFTPPRDYAADLPPGLEPILDRSLEKDPARRYQRARDMVEDLRRLLADAARDDLNETLSIASWAPTPPPPLSLPLPPPGNDTVAGIPPAPPAPEPPAPPVIPPAAAAPQPAAPQLPKAPRPPRPPRPPISWRRVAVAAGLPALALILVAVALHIRLDRSVSSAPIDLAGDARRARVKSLLKEGHELVRATEFSEAVKAYSEAFRTAPDKDERESIRRLIEKTQGQAVSYYSTLSAGEQINAYVLNARAALDDRRYADALATAELALAVDAGNEDALRVKAEAQKGLERLRKRPRTTPGATPGVAVAATPVQPEAGPSPEEAAASIEPARLRIVVHSEGPEVSVRLTLQGKVIFNGAFKGQRTGILRKSKPFTATSRTMEVPAGAGDLQVLVVPAGVAGRMRSLNGSFPSGTLRTLEIRVAGNGELTVNLV